MHNIFHAYYLHSYLSVFFQIANKEFTKPPWQLQQQHIFAFLDQYQTLLSIAQPGNMNTFVLTHQFAGGFDWL